MTDLADDHLRILSLARAALKAADDRALWKNTERGAAVHGAACDALWDELARQVDINDGKIPVLEHPSVKQVNLAKRMRSDIIAAVQNATAEALDNLISGALTDED